MTEPKEENLSSEGVAYVYGQYSSVEDAAIPIWDMGFMHADVCYDVTTTWKGNFFRLDDHINRFQNTLEGFRMKPELDADGMKEVLMECVKRAGHRDAYVYFGATRGMPMTEEYSRDPRDFLPQFMCFAVPYVFIISEEIMYGRGTHILVSKQYKRIPPESINPKLKNHAWPDLTFGLMEALEAGADQAILLDYDGNVTEGPGFNIFAVKNGVVATPSSGVLEGITRKSVAELCRELKLECQFRTVKGSELYEADEAFLTSSAGGIMPVSRVDDTALSGDQPGPISIRLKNLYWEKRKSGWHATPVDFG
ncbi:MAG: branched-chain amino acid transferase [Proteobacteria bacterium]|nr:branched-chain amino acid transferase [Pseudomonadota bacterium]